MIRNKRTTFAACLNSEETLTARSTVPRLAGPIDDEATQFHFPTETPECPRRRKVLSKDNPSWTPQR